MPATMDKKDVLYRVPFKNQGSIKWAVVTKFAGQQVPQPVKDEILRLLEDDKNTKMEAKLGMIRKGKKAELVMRVKNGSKHLFEKVLIKDYTPPTSSEKQDFDTKQDDGLRAAMKEVDVVYKQTEAFVAKLKTLSTELAKEHTAHDQAVSKLDPKSITLPNFMTFQLICSNRKRKLNDLVKQSEKALADHKKEISNFRNEGAGKIANRHKLDEDHKAKLTKKFSEHSKLLAQGEQKSKTFELKVTQFLNEVESSVKLFDANADKTQAIKDYLASSQKAWDDLYDAQNRNHFLKKDMEQYLKYNSKKNETVTVEGAIDFVTSKVSNAEKVYMKTNKRIAEALKKVSKDLLADQGIVRQVQAIGQFKTNWGKELQKFTERGTAARKHLESVLAELKA